MITRDAKACLLLSALTVCCLMCLTCTPIGPGDPPDGPPVDPPADTSDLDEELAEALGGSLDEVTEAQEAEAEADLARLSDASDELDSLLATMEDEEAAKAEMVNRLLGDPDVEWAQSTYFGIAMKYTDGTETGIVLDWEDDDPPDMVDGGGDDIDGSAFRAAKTARTLKSASLVASKKTIILNPHYWERAPLADKLVVAANTSFHECGLDYPFVYKNEQCSIGKFMQLSDYGVVTIYSHGLAYPSKFDAQYVFLMTGHIATRRSEAYLKTRDLEPGQIIYLWGPYGDEDTKKPIYLISADLIAKKNDFSASKSLVYLGFCNSYQGGFQNTIVESANAQAALGMDWSTSSRKIVDWAISMYSAMGDTSPDEPIDLSTWFYSDRHQYTRKDKDPDGNQITVTVRIRKQGNDETILWEKPEEYPRTYVGTGTRTLSVEGDFLGGGSAESVQRVDVELTLRENGEVEAVMTTPDGEVVEVPIIGAPGETATVINNLQWVDTTCPADATANAGDTVRVVQFSFGQGRWAGMWREDGSYDMEVPIAAYDWLIKGSFSNSSISGSGTWPVEAKLDPKGTELTNFICAPFESTFYARLDWDFTAQRVADPVN